MDLPLVLVVDDEVRSLESLRRTLDQDFEVLTTTDINAAAHLLEDNDVQVILCDQRMPEKSGVEFLKEVKERWPDVVRMIISGYTDAHDIIDGINDAGIFQYITKPWHPDNLILALKAACRLSALQRENELLAVELRMAPDAAGNVIKKRREGLRKSCSFDDGIIRAPGSPMDEVCKSLSDIAPYSLSVILHGSSGTGKELAARALHYGSPRWERPFVVENCGALPDELLESELFGHRKGAFTGAVADHTGLFERADGGTVFLDEIGETSAAFQVKLLRVLQEGEIRPLGSTRTRKVDVRVVAATNKDLEEEVKAKRFRADLFYRLAGMIVKLPDLKDRPSDLPLLIDSILTNAMEAMDKPVKGVSDEAMEYLIAYSWPGNVRELQNEVHRMLVRGKPDRWLDVDTLSTHFLQAGTNGARQTPMSESDADFESTLSGSLKDRVEALEAKVISDALIEHRWNKSKVARQLGLSRVGLRSKLDRYGLENVHPISRRAPN
ncbi:sigma-54-dependent Fis family transcriptional regulator [Erythrobacter sp. SCSIO 43205]|uniref:sigma-54-dependent transcriptional regulator n=1 Tax=Erythrobacter sp. SCSIO 43205 TaxID=2779361 RepID=UPI001CA8F585|nr:sigma-54 dependent transcriptional regulator [Erythrobacter sp. SCSIO 43205]UAB77838.1 sigma-54-dependent Fis family transcriptional regulator [Erythrobacter sp. SCSIO 43205]